MWSKFRALMGREGVSCIGIRVSDGQVWNVAVWFRGLDLLDEIRIIGNAFPFGCLEMHPWVRRQMAAEAVQKYLSGGCDAMFEGKGAELVLKELARAAGSHIQDRVRGGKFDDESGGTRFKVVFFGEAGSVGGA